MILVVHSDATVRATHEDWQEATVLALADYAGQRVVKTADASIQPGDPEPAEATVVREASA